jgi:hypothetical protein
MALPERTSLAFEGVIVASIDVFRAPQGGQKGGGGQQGGGKLRCRARVTTRGMWLDRGKILDAIHQVGFM